MNDHEEITYCPVPDEFTMLEAAVRALKWFIGRQERGRVASQFTVWVFGYVVAAIEAQLGAEIDFDFEEFDEAASTAFETQNPGWNIIR